MNKLGRVVFGDNILALAVFHLADIDHIVCTIYEKVYLQSFCMIIALDNER